MSRRVGLVVGDTPGHFYPALAVAQAYRRRDPDAEPAFFGPRDGRAAALAARYDFGYQPVSSSALARVGLAGKAAATIRTLRGIAEARGILKHTGIQLVIGFGGFASGGVLLAARSLGRKSAIHEANVLPGRANRLAARVVDRVFLSEWTERRYFPADRVVVTGWPVRDDVNELVTELHAVPADRHVRILVSAGSRGGRFFAERLPQLGAKLMALGVAVEIHHQSGDADPSALGEAYARADIPAEVEPFIGDIAGAYRWADLVIARAGAGTIAELALAGLPSILVPLPDAADDHQTPNARAFCAAGAASWITEPKWRTESLAAQVRAVLLTEAWTAASTAARRFATPSAAADVVDACEALLGDTA